MSHLLADESYWDLMRSVPHWMMEFTVEIVTGIVFAPVWRLIMRKHDAKHHSGDSRGD